MSGINLVYKVGLTRKLRGKMKLETVKNEILQLADRSNLALFATNGPEGYPHIKTMIKMENEGIKVVWFSTNTSSKRITQIQQDPKVSVYFLDDDKWAGLMLVGEVEIKQDEDSRIRFWREGNEKYYPLGVNDPDYTVLKFNAKWGNYYHSLANISFEVDQM